MKSSKFILSSFLISISLSISSTVSILPYMNTSPNWGVSLIITNSYNYKSNSSITNDQINIIDNKGDLWIPQPLDISFSTNYNQLKIKTKFFGSFQNAYELVRNESNYRGNCNGLICCDDNDIMSYNVAYNSSDSRYMFYELVSVDIGVDATVTIDSITYPFSSKSPLVNNNINASVTDTSDLTWIQSLMNNYYLVVRDNSSAPYSPMWIPKSLVGDAPNKIGITPTTFYNQNSTNVCSTNTIATNLNLLDQFAVSLPLSSIINNCTINNSSTILTPSNNSLTLDCFGNNYNSLLSIWLSSSSYPITISNSIPIIKNIGVEPSDSNDKITNLYIDILNNGSGLGVYQLSIFNCCSLNDCEVLKYDFNPQVLTVQAGSVNRTLFTIRSYDYLNPSIQYCTINIIHGIKYYGPIEIDFTTSISQYIPPPQYLVPSSSCSSLSQLKFVRGSDTYCINQPTCTNQQVYNSATGLCKPKPDDPIVYQFYSSSDASYMTVPGCDGVYNPATNQCVDAPIQNTTNPQPECLVDQNSNQSSSCLNMDGAQYNETVILPGTTGTILKSSGIIIIIIIVVAGLVVLGCMGRCIYRCFFRKSSLERNMAKLNLLPKNQSFIIEKEPVKQQGNPRPRVNRQNPNNQTRSQPNNNSSKPLSPIPSGNNNQQQRPRQQQNNRNNNSNNSRQPQRRVNNNGAGDGQQPLNTPNSPQRRKNINNGLLG